MARFDDSKHFPQCGQWVTHAIQCTVRENQVEHVVRKRLGQLLCQHLLSALDRQRVGLRHDVVEKLRQPVHGDDFERGAGRLRHDEAHVRQRARTDIQEGEMRLALVHRTDELLLDKGLEGAVRIKPERIVLLELRGRRLEPLFPLAPLRLDAQPPLRERLRRVGLLRCLGQPGLQVRDAHPRCVVAARSREAVLGELRAEAGHLGLALVQLLVLLGHQGL
mmetsp:Transcript_16914/g.48115  ORF Transcript_16914/g.48115 Transcript_16914/m.48115 type:complete len:221 (-) Transcript_16914:355-1017(-)